MLAPVATDLDQSECLGLQELKVLEDLSEHLALVSLDLHHLECLWGHRQVLVEKSALLLALVYLDLVYLDLGYLALLLVLLLVLAYLDLENLDRLHQGYSLGRLGHLKVLQKVLLVD